MEIRTKIETKKITINLNEIKKENIIAFKAISEIVQDYLDEYADFHTGSKYDEIDSITFEFWNNCSYDILANFSLPIKKIPDYYSEEYYAPIKIGDMETLEILIGSIDCIELDECGEIIKGEANIFAELYCYLANKFGIDNKQIKILCS